MTEKKDNLALVSEIIDTYTRQYLDTTIRQGAKDIAKKELSQKGFTGQKVADAVFDYINEGYSGSATMAAICQQVCPKTILYVMRGDIMATLK